MANPFDFSAGAVLTAAQLNSIGDWTAYTPTWGNITLGSGGAAATSSAKYAEVNGVVLLSGSLTFGSGTSITGNVSMSLPVTAADVNKVANGVLFTYLDASTTVHYEGRARKSTTSAVYAYVYYAASTYVSLVDISDNTKPFPAAWTTSDVISFSAMYEAA